MAGKKGPTKAQVFQVYKNIINGRHGRFEPFPARYFVTKPADGVFKVLTPEDEGGEVVRYVPLEEVAAAILKYSDEHFAMQPAYLLTKKDAVAAAQFWLAATPVVPMPKAFSWPGETGLTFTKLPWAPAAGAMPTWDAMLSRMTNREAFMAWVGSLFDEQSYLQQYVWVYGEGNDGKGSINRFLYRIFGPAYCSKQPKERGDKHWSHELLGKRLVVFPDCNDHAFVASGFFKSLTGGDPIAVEAKYEMAYTARFNAKFLILSNERPSLSSENADRRRIIYCELGSVADADITDRDGFEAALWGEGGAFIHACLASYNKAAGAGRAIPARNDEIGGWIETIEADFEEVFEMYFEFDDFNPSRKNDWASPIYLQRVLKREYKYKKQQVEFIRYLERRFGIKKTVTHGADGKQHKVYQGLVRKTLILIEGGGNSGYR